MISQAFGRRWFVLASLVSLAAGASAAPISAISVRRAWTRPTMVGMNAAGYLTIVNSGRFADRLVSVASPAAARVSLHQSRQAGPVMTMRAVSDLPIPSGGQVALAPGGYHLMLEGLRRPLRSGGRVSVTLTFERAAPIHAWLTVGAGPAIPDMKM